MKLAEGKGELFDRNVAQLLDFMQGPDNPFLIIMLDIELHDFITEHIVNN